MPGYAGLLAALSLLGIAPVRCAASGWWEVVGIVLALLAAVAAVAAARLDLVENRALGKARGMARDRPTPENPTTERLRSARRPAADRSRTSMLAKTAAWANRWKLRLLAGVAGWLDAALTLAVTHWLG